MKFTKEQASFVKENKDVIRSILARKLEDIIEDILYSDNDEKVKTLRLWAVEVKELMDVIDNSLIKKENKENKTDTGI